MMWMHVLALLLPQGSAADSLRQALNDSTAAALGIVIDGSIGGGAMVFWLGSWILVLALMVWAYATILRRKRD